MNITNKSGVMGHYKISIKDKDGNLKSLWQENKLGELLGIQIPGITGNYTTEYRTKNHIVDDGLEELAKGAIGDSAPTFKFIALGTDDTLEEDDDSELRAEILDRGIERAEATTQSVTANVATLVEEFEVTGSAANIPIKEIGIFDDVTPAGSTMLSRTVITTKNVDTDDKITVTYELTLSRT